MSKSNNRINVKIIEFVFKSLSNLIQISIKHEKNCLKRNEKDEESEVQIIKSNNFRSIKKSLRHIFHFEEER